MFVTVALCTHNGAPLIGQQLDALIRQQLDEPWEILVVDNDSDDDTPALVDVAADRHDRIRVVRATDQHNLAYARNVAARASSSDYLTFVDDDDVVGEGWLDAIVRAFETSPLIGSRLEYQLLNRQELLVGRARLQSEGLSTFVGHPVVAGAGHGVARALFDRLDGNDESWSFSGEDFDFSLRAAEIGVEPAWARDAVYHYRIRGGGRPAFRQARTTGRAHVALARRFGGPDRRTVPASGSWWWLASRAPAAAAGRRRELWARRAGVRVGHADQRIRHLLGERVGRP